MTIFTYLCLLDAIINKLLTRCVIHKITSSLPSDIPSEDISDYALLILTHDDVYTILDKSSEEIRKDFTDYLEITINM